MTLRRAWPAAFAVLLLLVGQLSALAHQSSTRHVTCAEHGEELEAAQLAGPVDACEHGHWIGVEGAEGEHEDCAIARLLHQSSAAPKPFIALLPTADSITTSTPAARAVIATIDLVLLAPKTSPPPV